MKKILALMLALVMVLALAACGDKEPEVDITGKYNATSCFYEGEEVPCDGEYVKLDPDGKGTIMFMDTEYDITWSLKGEELTFTDSEGDKFAGTCIDGVIDGNYAGMDYVFTMGGGKKVPAAPAAEPEAEPEPEPAPAADFEPVSGDLRDGFVTILAAEAFTDINDEPAIRVYFDFTNTSDELTCAWMSLNDSAIQDNRELDDTTTHIGDEVPEDGNRGQNQYPGTTLRCIYEYSYNPDGGVVVFTLSDYSHELIAEFDPTNLPGRPGDFTLETISDPSYTSGWPTEAEFDDHAVALQGAEVVDSYDGGKVIRIYFDFTNNTDEDTDCWMETNFRVYQDGVELDTLFGKDDVEEEENYTKDIAPGETIRCAETWGLRSDSPVEIIDEDTWDDIHVGAIYPVT